MVFLQPRSHHNDCVAFWNSYWLAYKENTSVDHCGSWYSWPNHAVVQSDHLIWMSTQHTRECRLKRHRIAYARIFARIAGTDRKPSVVHTLLVPAPPWLALTNISWTTDLGGLHGTPFADPINPSLLSDFITFYHHHSSQNLGRGNWMVTDCQLQGKPQTYRKLVMNRIPWDCCDGSISKTLHTTTCNSSLAISCWYSSWLWSATTCNQHQSANFCNDWPTEVFFSVSSPLRIFSGSKCRWTLLALLLGELSAVGHQTVSEFKLKQLERKTSL